VNSNTTTEGGKMSTETFAADFAELMAAWNKIEAYFNAQHPNADDEAVYEMTAAAMRKELGI